MISHFILNLQDISTTTANGSGSLPTTQLSSVRFVDSVIGNLGASLRDVSQEDNEDEEITDNKDIGLSDLPLGDDETQIGASADVREDNIAGPSNSLSVA